MADRKRSRSNRSKSSKKRSLQRRSNDSDEEMKDVSVADKRNRTPSRKKDDLMSIGSDENVESASEGDDLEEMEDLIPNEQLDSKLDRIMTYLESLDIDKEIGKKEVKSDTRIIISEIVLENFKSYAGRVRLGPLHFRFNSVVGPNGSGKSNLMECLLFVFGKKANKMRLKKLSELIHSSAASPDNKFAQVTIKFREIKEGENDSFEYVEGGDFVVARAVYKNSGSKYFLNGSESKFEDVNAILSKKGIDLKHNRFLILQGEVEQIALMKQKAVNENDAGLLEYLEDIIGTNRYINVIDKLSSSIDQMNEIRGHKLNRVKISKNALAGLENIKNESIAFYRAQKKLMCFTHLTLNVEKGDKVRTKKKYEDKENALEKDAFIVKDEFTKKGEEYKNSMQQKGSLINDINDIKKEIAKCTKMIDEYETKDKMKMDEKDN